MSSSGAEWVPGIDRFADKAFGARLIAYPVISGGGKPLFPSIERRRGLELRRVQPLDGGRLSLSYGIA